ncbi:MAG: ABC transporter permease subunit [Actinomycetota bacterium]|nr:ABC transporter permease subunit [Actinomycetota bacterium]
MRWKMVKAVIKVDLFKLIKSRDYWIPLIILGGMFFVVMPVMLLGAMSFVKDTGAVAQISDIIGTLPTAIQENIQGDNGATRASYAFAVYLLAPIAIIVPLTISSAVGSTSIVGEREQGTGEFLAHSPLTVKEIYVGKLIASLIPGYAAGIVGFGLYSIVVNVIVGSQLGRWFFPTAGWLLLVLWVVPPFIAIAIALSLILRLSARVRSAASAHQASSLVTLPVIVMSYAVASGLLYSPVISAAIAGLVAWIIAAVLLASGAKSIRRERLLGVSADL